MSADTVSTGPDSNVVGRPVVVTGGGHGIGAALAAEAAHRGASAVVVCDIDEAAAHATASAIGPQATARFMDVTDSDSVSVTADEIIANVGLPGVVFANAGVGPAQGPLLDLDPTDAAWVLGVNTLGVLATMQAFGRPMAMSDTPGHLVATASEHALGRPHSGLGIYTASKHAVLGMCDVMRDELPAHVGISVLCPGLTQSRFAEAVAHRPDAFGGPGVADPLGSQVIARGMPAAVVAQRAFDGVAAGHFLIPTHYNARAYAIARAEEVDASFARLADIDTTDWDVGTVVTRLLHELPETSERSAPTDGDTP